MKTRMYRFARSLELRLLAPLAAIIALVLSAHGLLGYWEARDQVDRFVRADLERSTSLIASATHDGMLLNRLDEVQARIERLGASPGFTAIRIYSKDGRIALSSDPAERDLVVGIRSNGCVACHPGEQLTGPQVAFHRNLVQPYDGHEVQRSLTAIRNEPSCAAVGCHVSPAHQTVLGVLDVQMTMAPFDEAIARAKRQLAWTTASLVLASGLVAGLFIRRLVHEPVARIHEGTLRIAAGDLDTRIRVSGRHELAELADAFNGMAADLKAARDELGTWSRTLEQKVEEKTAELRKTQQNMSRIETMVSLGKLCATVAHELNNPLSGVLTYVRLVRRELAEQPLDPNVKEELESQLSLVDKECVRCGAIVKNLLTFARGTGVRLGPTDLNQILEHSIMLVRHHLEIHKVKLETTPLAGDATIVADAAQIQQTFLALLMNAIEAMQGIKDRPCVLDVRLEGDDTSVRLRVSDTGVGMPADLIPHIFEPFVTTKGETSGVGLGLSVVYGVVHAHGGEIGVQSEPGVGTTFTVTLPRRRSDPPRAESEVVVTPAGRSPAPSREGVA